MNNTKILLLSCAALALPSCTAVGLAAGAGVAVGTAAVQEGGISRAMSDARIQAEINERWFSHDINMFAKLDLTINQGRVLITGVVQDPQHRVEAVRLAWQPVGVVQVMNEIKVADSEGFVGYAKDVWISGRLRTALIMDMDVESINYSIDTVQGTVYLMGFAHNQGELNHVIEKARSVEGVKQVVSYVKLAGVPEQRTAGYVPPHAGQGDPVNGVATQPQSPPPQGRAADGEPIQWSQESIYD
jgi:osmotically-inducible protein OsmY